MINKVIFDTNIYGYLAKDRDINKVEIIKDKNFQIFGINEIRREIKNVKWSSKELYQTILKLYNTLIEKEYVVDPHDKTTKLAQMYYKEYRLKKGKKPWKDLRVDLIVVACATIKQMDVVYSGDRESMGKIPSMHNKILLDTYREVNNIIGYRTPNFLKYVDLKKRFGWYKSKKEYDKYKKVRKLFL